MTTSMFFMERFGGKKLTVKVKIPKFIQGKDPEEHIARCESEWKRLGYRDERAWPHMFPNMLDDLPSKWFKLEEA